ncbi:MAG TPA: DUF1801 domain-containing protein [Ignavibacteriaceae bacterium]
MNKIPPKNIETYIALQPENVRAALEKMRQVIKTAAPDAEEVISYGMPAYRYHGMLVYFAGFKNHYSLFPGNASLIAEMAEDLKAYKTSKGTIQFSPDKPLPVGLIKKIVKIRMKENLAKQKK